MDERLLGVIDTPVAVLGTIIPDGRPHLVPVTFAASGESLVTAVDWKPKTGRKLRRISNLEADPRASLLIHHYSEEWGDLWWVRVDATATIHRTGPEWERAIAALVDKYPQYRERPPEGAVISLRPENVISWPARP